MPRYKWTVEFEAEDGEEASEQANDAMLGFESIYTEKLVGPGEEDDE